MDALSRRAADLRQCAADGMTRYEAAVRMDLPYRTIKRLAARLGLEMETGTPGPRAPRGAKPASLAEKGEGTTRRCLCGCNRTFLSLHVGERISPRCRAAWSER